MARTSVNVNNEVFLAKYLEFQSKGSSFEDLGVELKLAPLSCYQRMNKLSKELSVQGVELPRMPLKVAQKVSVDKLVEIFNKHTKNYANNVVETQDTNTVKQDTDALNVDSMNYVDA